MINSKVLSVLEELNKYEIITYDLVKFLFYPVHEICTRNNTWLSALTPTGDYYAIYLGFSTAFYIHELGRKFTLESGMTQDKLFQLSLVEGLSTEQLDLIVLFNEILGKMEGGETIVIFVKV